MYAFKCILRAAHKMVAAKIKKNQNRYLQSLDTSIFNTTISTSVLTFNGLFLNTKLSRFRIKIRYYNAGSSAAAEYPATNVKWASASKTLNATDCYHYSS